MAVGLGLAAPWGRVLPAHKGSGAAAHCNEPVSRGVQELVLAASHQVHEHIYAHGNRKERKCYDEQVF